MNRVKWAGKKENQKRKTDPLISLATLAMYE